jgi:hypothetical protein
LCSSGEDRDSVILQSVLSIPVIGFSQLPLSPETAQKELPLQPPSEDPNDVDIEEELKQAIQEPKTPPPK